MMSGRRDAKFENTCRFIQQRLAIKAGGVSSSRRRSRLVLGACLTPILLIAMTPGTATGASGLSRAISGGYPAFDEKTGTPWIAQIDKRKKYDQAYAPNENILAPYAKASLGAGVAYLLINGHDVISAPDAQSLCQKIVDDLLAGWQGAKPKVRVQIVGKAAYGAVAISTGDIIVNIGTFNTDISKGVATKDELALMLGHELAHILLPHLKKQQNLERIVKGLAVASNYALVGSALSTAEMQGNNIRLRPDTEQMGQIVVSGIASKTLVGDLLEPSWQNDQESEADMLGADLADRAGYFVTGAEIEAFVLKHAESSERRTAQMQLLQNIATAYVMSKKPVQDKTGGYLDNLWKAMSAKVVDFTFNQIAKMTKDHPDRQKRLDALSAYAGDLGYIERDTDSDGNIIPHHEFSPEETPTQLVDSAVAAQRVQDYIVARSKTPVRADTAVIPANFVPSAPEGAQTSADDFALISPCADPPAKAVSPEGPALVSVSWGRGQTRMIPLPVPKPGSDADVSIAAAEATAEHKIDGNFPIEEAPFTWRIRGEWRAVSPGCTDRAVEDWQHIARLNYADVGTLRKLTLNLANSDDAKLLPPLYDQYLGLIGTDDDFPDLAIAAAVAREDRASAEVKAAQCYKKADDGLYPLCVRLLGYDPTNKDTGPKTAEGQRAFRKFGTGKSGVFNRPTDDLLKDLFK